jgi:hypothetical protein
MEMAWGEQNALCAIASLPPCSSADWPPTCVLVMVSGSSEISYIKYTNVLEKHTTSIFSPEDEDSMFLENTGTYMSLHGVITQNTIIITVKTSNLTFGLHCMISVLTSHKTFFL